MIEGLEDLIRTRLRERIMERIEPDIKAAIDSSIEHFKATIETYRDPYQMRDTIKVIIERRDAPSQ